MATMSRKRKKKRVLTPDELKLMKSLLEQGVSGKKVAERIKCSTSVVSERKKAWFGPKPVEKPPEPPQPELTHCPKCDSPFSEEKRCVRCDALNYQQRKKDAEEVGIEYPDPYGGGQPEGWPYKNDWLDDLLDEKWSE